MPEPYERKNLEKRLPGPAKVGRGGSGSMGGAKAYHFGKAGKALLYYCKSQLPAICGAVFLAVAGTLLTVAGPEQFKRMTDVITDGLYTGIDAEAATRAALLLVCLYSISFCCSLLQGVMMASVTQATAKSLRRDISQKINRLPLRYFDTTSIGNTLSRITNDVETLTQALGQSFSGFVAQAALFCGTLAMMLYTNRIMTLSALAATALSFGLMSLLASRSQSYFIQQQAGLGQLNGYIEEYYTGQSIVKAYNGEKEAKRRFRVMNDELYRSAWKSQFISGLSQPLMGFVSNLGYVVVCIVGALLAWHGMISFGVIVAFMLYINLFTGTLSQFSSMLMNLQAAAAASERIFDFLAEPELSDESGKQTALEQVNGDVEFRNVCFGYSKEKPVLRHFSAQIKAGQKIAIVGPTGAGKTTLVNLLLGFYEPESGEILIDGTAVSQLTREALRSLFCMVLQDTWLFEGTIRENIVYNKADVSPEAVEAACKAVGLHPFVQTLPKGYDTMLSDHASLSAGQKQLIAIARAMVQDRPMLILDEATSAVDTHTEILIQKAMDSLTVGRTSFVIAHRLSTIRNADLILVMKDGDIIERGNHVQLLEKGGFYAQLYHSQFAQAV